jgi:hypothetical protein
MKDIYRILIALSMLVSGAVLLPVMGLPTEGFNWQRYAGAYTPATLAVNHLSGQPGSFFTVSGSHFTPNTLVNVSANGALLGQVQADANGELVFLIDSTGADTGTYFIEATGAETGLAQFDLREDAQLWPQEGEGVVFNLPAGIGLNMIRLPVIIR